MMKFTQVDEDTELLYIKKYAEVNNPKLKVIHLEEKYLDASLTISGVIKDKSFISPHYGTCSNIQLKYTSAHSIKIVINNFINGLKSNYSNIHITFPSQIYNDNISIILCQLYSNGLALTKCEINNHISLKSETKFNKSNRKQLRKLQKENYSFNRLDLDQLTLAYNILNANRREKGVQLSLSLDQLTTLCQEFPNFINIWGVNNQRNETVASAITIDLTSDSRYVVYWGELPNHRQYSPVVLLADGLIRCAKNEGKDILDLGTSSVNSDVDGGLLQFKNSLGAENSLKLTLGN